MLGGLTSSVFVQIALNNNATSYQSGFSHYALPAHTGQLTATGISIAMALAAGIAVGLVINFLGKEVTPDHYHDRSYWLTEQDCISMSQDIHLPSQEDLSQSSEDTEHLVETYKEVVIRH